MLVIKIELHSAITGAVSEIGRMNIANEGTGTAQRGDYKVQVIRRSAPTDKGFWDYNASNVTRTGEVKNYPRLSYNVWRLITRALLSAFPEEQRSGNPKPTSAGAGS